MSKRLEKKYREIIKDKTYFEIDDVNKLNVDWKILFVLGKKNIGKSYQLRKLLTELKEDERVVFGRYSKGELDVLKTSWNLDESFPFGVKGEKIIDKKTGRYRGQLVKFKNLQTSASMNYDGVKYIIFDEIIPLDPKLITKAQVEAFIKFLSNVERNKSDLKVLLFGNNNGINELMNAFNLGVADFLIWKKDIKMLYINTFELFKGIESQEITAGILKYIPAIEESLLSNKPLSMSQRLLPNAYALREFDPYLAIVLDNEVLEIRRKYFEKYGRSQLWFTIFANWFSPSVTDEFRCYTFDLTTTNRFDNVYYLDGEQREQIKKFLKEVLQSKRFLYINDAHVDKIIDILKK